MKQTTLRDKLCNLITEMDQPLSTSFTYQNTTCTNNSNVQSQSFVSHTKTPSSFDFSRIYRSENSLMKVRRSVSTFDCFMKANKIKKKIGRMNDDYFPCSKTFTSFNKPLLINSKIVNNTNFNKEIAALSPTFTSTKKKHFYLSDIMRTKYTFSSLNPISKDKKPKPLSKKELLKTKDKENFNTFLLGFPASTKVLK